MGEPSPVPFVLKCPFCGRENEFHDSEDPAVRPKPEDASLCWTCREVSVYDGDEETGEVTGLRKPTPEEKQQIESHPDFRRYRAVLMESYYPEEALKMLRGG